jgi:phospholipid/cholesterol/gamma-HCH transport system substrate-binding protein
MENRAYAIAVGIFTLVLGAGVVFIAMWFSGDTEKRDTYRLESRFAVTGLNIQAPVRFRGVEVGRVESIAFDSKSARSILIAVSVKSDTPITRGTYAQLGSQGVTGLAYVILDDDGDKPERLSPADSEKTRIPVRQSFFDEVAGAGKGLMTDANEVARRLRTLLSEGNQAQLMKTLASLEMATRNIADAARKLDPALRNMPAVTEEARKAFARADSLLANMDRLTTELVQRVDTLERVSKGAEQVGGAAQSLSSATVADTLPRINALLEELARNSRNLDRLLIELSDQPASLVFGRPGVAPGPGESGFNPRGGKSQ